MRPHHSQACNSWRVGVGVGGVILTGWVQGAKDVTIISSKYELCCVGRYLFCCFYRAAGTAVFAWGVCLAKWRWRYTCVNALPSHGSFQLQLPTYRRTFCLPLTHGNDYWRKKSCVKRYFNLSQFLLVVFFMEWNRGPLNLSFTSFLSSLTKVPKAHFNLTFPIILLIPDITQSAQEADRWDTHAAIKCLPTTPPPIIPTAINVPIQSLLNINALVLCGYIFVVNLQLQIRRCWSISASVIIRGPLVKWWQFISFHSSVFTLSPSLQVFSNWSDLISASLLKQCHALGKSPF